MKKTIAIALCLIFIIAVAGCSDSKSRSKGVYMLLDTSGTYALELKKAQSILNYLLGVLQPGDTLAVARIDTGSFSEKDIVAKITFDERPSYANNEKRMFQQEVNTFVSTVKSSQYTDISGGILQAIEYLNEQGSGQKHVLIFSDLKQELAKGYKRDIPFQLQGFNVIALNVTKLRADNIDPKKYQRRVTRWRAEIESGGGTWDIINDLEIIHANTNKIGAIFKSISEADLRMYGSSSQGFESNPWDIDRFHILDRVFRISTPDIVMLVLLVCRPVIGMMKGFHPEIRF